MNSLSKTPRKIRSNVSYQSAPFYAVIVREIPLNQDEESGTCSEHVNVRSQAIESDNFGSKLWRQKRIDMGGRALAALPEASGNFCSASGWLSPGLTFCPAASR